nr:hypothetical protein [Allomuricauda sp.]
MSKKKRHWFWNLLIFLTLAFCLSAFTLHYKNWYEVENGELKILSGAYYQRLPLEEIDSVMMVERIPEMERAHGFSWLAKEKGVFKDSLTESKVYVFVDDLRQQKIRLVHKDTLKIFINFTDSLTTQRLFENLNDVVLAKNEKLN